MSLSDIRRKYKEILEESEEGSSSDEQVDNLYKQMQKVSRQSNSEEKGHSTAKGSEQTKTPRQNQRSGCSLATIAGGLLDGCSQQQIIRKVTDGKYEKPTV